MASDTPTLESARFAGALDALKLARALLDRRDSRGLAALQRVARTIRDVAVLSGDEPLADLAEAVEDTGLDPDGSVKRLLYALRVRIFQPRPREGGVLVVTANAEDREDRLSIVSPLTQRLLEADSPARAAQLLQRNPVSAVLLELDARPAEGLTLIGRIRSDPTLAGVPVLVLARDPSPLLRAEVRALGATELLELPTPDERLSTCLQTLMGLQSAMDLELASDPATGLQTPTALKTIVRKLRHDAEVTQQPYCLVLARPEGFTSLQQRNPSAARELLKSAATHLVALRGPENLFAWKDDYMVVLLPEADANEATATLKSLAQALSTRDTPLVFGGVEVLGMGFEQCITSARRMFDLAEQAAMGPVVTPVSSAAPPRHRILVVEDDRTVGEIVVRALKRAGLNAVLREDGLQALEVAEALRFDLVITDVVMPYMDGLTFVRKLREIPRYKRTPIIVLTSLDSERHVIEGFSTGADSYVTKPFNPRILQARVHSLLDRNQG